MTKLSAAVTQNSVYAAALGSSLFLSRCSRLSKALRASRISRTNATMLAPSKDVGQRMPSALAEILGASRRLPQAGSNYKA
jgi:hypothetical protein